MVGKDRFDSQYTSLAKSFEDWDPDIYFDQKAFQNKLLTYFEAKESLHVKRKSRNYIPVLQLSAQNLNNTGDNLHTSAGVTPFQATARSN